MRCALLALGLLAAGAGPVAASVAGPAGTTTGPAVPRTVAPEPATGLEAAPGEVQERPDTVRVSGVVRGPDGAPAEGANVFLLPTLEGDVTDGRGRFSVATTRRDTLVLVVEARGLAADRRPVVPPRSGLAVQMSRPPVELQGLSVAVSSTPTAGRPDAEMTSLDVVRTPGASGDPLRALKTRAGVLAVDEGVSLHVQGGAAPETRVLLDGSTLLAPYRTASASGVEFGSVDPFLLDDISLTTAGFDARVGDALSGVVRGESRGPPPESGATLTAMAAGASGRLDVSLGEGLGVRLAGGVSDLGPLFQLHGRGEEFVRAPRGSEGSVSVAWRRSPGAGMKLFAVGRRDRFVSREEGGGPDTFGWRSEDHHAVLSTRGVFGPVAASASLAASGTDRSRTFGAFRLREQEALLQARGEVEWQVSTRLVLRGGGVLERRDADMRGSLGATGPGAGADSVVFDSRVDGVRRGGFLQAEWEPERLLGLKAGVRVDRSTLTRSTTHDPRLAALVRPGDDLEVELAWGRYHQVPEPLALEPTVGAPRAGPMEATHWTAGLRGRSLGPLGRLQVKLYRKAYGSLVQEDRAHRHVAGGVGAATGLDVLAAATAPGGVELQAAVSLVDARRTDPDTGETAPSPFETSPSVALQAKRSWPAGFELGLAYRFGRGRPFTPVVGAHLDAERGDWVPEFGRPGSDRLPDLRRLDLSASWVHRLWEGNLTTVFLSVTNLLDRDNVSEVRYDRDFSERILVRSSFHRTLFAGVTAYIPF